MVERIGNAEVSKLVEWDKGSSLGISGTQAKNSFATSHCQACCSVISKKKKKAGFLAVAVTWEDKYYHSECIPLTWLLS